MADPPRLDPGGRPPRWAGRFLRLCLRAWPAGARARHGPAVLEAAEAALADAAARGGRPSLIRETFAEGLGLVASGLPMRVQRMRVQRIKVLTRLGPRGVLVRGWGRDLRYGVRTLLRSPGFTGVAVATLALGIGANAAVFALVDRVLFRPPPFERPDELVLVWNHRPAAPPGVRTAGREEARAATALPDRTPVAAPDAGALRERVRSFAEVAFLGRPRDAALEAGEGSGVRHVRVAGVGGDLFGVLGVDAVIGRTFGPGGAPEAESAPVAVLAHRLWRDAFGSDPGVVGRTVALDGTPVTVVGVMPPEFRVDLPPGAGFGSGSDLWLRLPGPLRAIRRTDGRRVDQDSDNRGAVLARLAPGASLEDAAREVQRVAAALRARVPARAEAGMGFDVRSLRADATAHARPLLLTVLAGVGVVLLVACLNLATLFAGRAVARREEMALRVVLGAGRGRIVRQLLAEGLVLVSLGAGVSLLVAQALGVALTRRAPAELAGGVTAGLDGRVLAFTAGVAACTVLLAGLAPAVRAGRAETRGALRGALERWGGSRRTPGRALVVAEVALTVVLMTGTALLFRSVRALQEVDPGFEPGGALTFELSVRSPDRYVSPGERARLMKEIERSVASLPGVEAVGLVGVLPLGGGRWTQPWGLPGEPEDEWSSRAADFRVASSGYMAAMGVRLLEGRTFTPREDLQEDERVVVVDELLARTVAPHGSAVGAEVGIPLDGSPVRARIVGVVQHVRHETLEADGRPTVYVPYRQEASREVAFVVRATGDPVSLAPAVRRAVAAVDSRLPVYEVRTLEDYVASAMAPRRFGLALLGGFAGLALLAALIGLYGVVALEVGRRRREMGVRVALGARPTGLVRGVVVGGLRLGATGFLAGAALVAVSAPWLRSVLFDVTVTDPATWILVAGLVLAVTAAASWLPARRIAGTDAMEVLAAE